MACVHPLKGYRSAHKSLNGKRQVMVVGRGAVDVPKGALVNRAPCFLPCGKCVGCRKERARMWAVRCVHEAQMHKANCFITLTYNDVNLPKNGSLVKADWQLFMKRLRERVLKSNFKKRFRKLYEGDPDKIKFYMCGEYGTDYSRPHYHACLFGVDFPDKVIHSSKNDFKLYRSPTLEKLWKKGYSTIGDVSYASALYLAKYIMKSYDKDLAGSVYGPRLPEFALMSRGGRTGKGIASTWIEKYITDVFPKDYVVINGVKYPVPKYYKKRLMLTNRLEFDTLRDERFVAEDAAMQVKSLKEIYRGMDAMEVVQTQFNSMAERPFEKGDMPNV